MNGNAKIKSTVLGYEDHGMITCFLNLEQSGSGQGFGGYRLDAPKGKTSIYGTFWIKRILDTVGVSSWEELPGKFIRVEGSHAGITRIGHITDEKWFEPKKEIEALNR